MARREHWVTSEGTQALGVVKSLVFLSMRTQRRSYNVDTTSTIATCSRSQFSSEIASAFDKKALSTIILQRT